MRGERDRESREREREIQREEIRFWGGMLKRENDRKLGPRLSGGREEERRPYRPSVAVDVIMCAGGRETGPHGCDQTKWREAIKKRGEKASKGGAREP